MKNAKIIWSVALLLLAACTAQAQSPVAGDGPVKWQHLSTVDGGLPAPGQVSQQTASLIFDVDRDGVNDFVIGSRQGPGGSLVWYRREADGWTVHPVEDEVLDIEAGGDFYDVDGDGDLDIVMGGDYSSNRVWWWENPYPDYMSNTPWTRREIKNDGQSKHHDQMFGDFDGDGTAELVFWNQGAGALYLAEIPENPHDSQPWPYTAIYSWSGGAEHEGLAQADIDGDGQLDIVGGGRWFKHNGGTSFTANVIDDGQRFGRAAAGQLIGGGRPEAVFVTGDGVGRLKWYQWDGDVWVDHDLLDVDVDHGHSLALDDIDGDGHLDIFVAEMRLDDGNSHAHMWTFYGDGQGNFTKSEVASGYGNHESRVADLDGDGDLDILGKPYNWETPRVDIWLNRASSSARLGMWERHLIDAERPWRAIFVDTADVDGDGLQDVLTGGWWYKNPGEPAGAWSRLSFGSPLNNMAAVYDFDGDGDYDVLGTGGQGSDTNASFVWARNDGTGNFTILNNVSGGDGDFLQGVAIERFQDNELQVLLSWHQADKGIQRLTVPGDPADEKWSWERVSDGSQDEALSVGDIDGDGDPDLLLGTQWLRNDGNTWTPFTLNPTAGDPDRNRLVDVNGDGRLDAVVGFEAISTEGKLAWYEQGDTATGTWTEHVIADPPVIGPMSLDAADMDDDGDIDVIVGEHNTENPASAALYIFENDASVGTSWTRHTVYVGDEHHDGAQVVDIDGDGDLDIISIGWTHDRVVLYENQAAEAPTAPTPTPTATPPVPPLATPPSGRVTDGQQVLYTFNSGEGAAVEDMSGVEPRLPLTIVDDAAIAWLEGGGLVISGATIVSSNGAATKLIDGAQNTDEITVELWLKAANISQSGPARILTLSVDPYNRNFTLGQEGDTLEARLRTTETSENGTPALITPEGALSTDLSHVVYTRDASGAAKIFVNGVERASGTIAGEFQNWNAAYPLALANEITRDRPWLGELHLVALFNRALTAEEVVHNYSVGIHTSASPTLFLPGAQGGVSSAISASAPPLVQLAPEPTSTEPLSMVEEPSQAGWPVAVGLAAALLLAGLGITAALVARSAL